jgi:tripartite-type tricarboxylate transporter receptor subunit TctC
MKRTIASLVAVVGALGFAATSAQAAEDFYKGKTINIEVSGEGTYENYARILGKYLTKYIPGNPTVIVKTMLGASGLKATNYIYNVAPKDGTDIAGVHGQIMTQPMFNPEGVQYDSTKLNYIGNITRETFIGYVWHTSPVQSMEEARQKEAIVGGQAVGSMSIDMAIMANAMMGTKFKIVTGYKGSQETRLAVQRGELNGHFGTAYTTITSENPDWLRDHLIKIIAQFGEVKHKAMPDVPLLLDYVITPEDKAALRLFLSRTETGKPFFAPPGIPADRLAILRKAFDQSIKDPSFLADCEKLTLDVNQPMSGEELQAYIGKLMQTPPSAVDRINKVMAAYKEKK